MLNWGGFALFVIGTFVGLFALAEYVERKGDRMPCKWGWSSWGSNARAARAVEAIDRWERRQIEERMQAGPFFDAEAGELRIPSYVYDYGVTPVAAAEWKRRGFLFDGEKREWYRRIPAAAAAEQVRRARDVFNRIWKIQS